MARLAVTRRRAIAYRLRANHLDRRLPPGAYDDAASFALLFSMDQRSAPDSLGNS